MTPYNIPFRGFYRVPHSLIPYEATLRHAGNADIVALLLDAGADANLQDNQGDTTLLHASFQGKVGVYEN